ncbi:MAG: hypothetical protein MJZ76_07760 [Bacteroidales bacterium]|nr:hypothetical protein [Bacteroidales bacterium]
MKRVAILFCIVVLSVIFISCNKHCKCTGYIAGEAGEPYKVELNKEEATSCDDLSTVEELNGTKVGVECK